MCVVNGVNCVEHVFAKKLAFSSMRWPESQYMIRDKLRVLTKAFI